MGSNMPQTGPFGSRDGTGERGEWDEYPAHNVTLSNPFFISTTQITNAQYELYDPNHRLMRGKGGISNADNDAVVFISWDDAAGYCEWLSEIEGLPYRLPTEAEWEYACRAGTETLYNIGDRLPDGFQKINPDIGPIFFIHWFNENHLPGEYRIDRSGSTAVHTTPPNIWGLFDMHGNVEEWCMDWFGPYDKTDQHDPPGAINGDFRVTRGGSHSQFVKLLTSANRGGSLPEARTPTIGFRIALGDMPNGIYTPRYIPDNQDQVASVDHAREIIPSDNRPIFHDPLPFVKIPTDSMGPLYSVHNHHPAISKCPNGDLLAIWYTCVREPGTELSIAASRLRAGNEEWDIASPFWDMPDRNDHGPILWVREDGTIFHMNGNYGGLWGDEYSTLTGTIMRKSTDSGVTWSSPKQICPELFPMPSVIRLKDNSILAPFDHMPWFTRVYTSKDEGESWSILNSEHASGDCVRPGGTGPYIAGIHAPIIELKDGRLMAFGRLDDPAGQARFNGMMPMSISDDGGTNWNYHTSKFPSVSSCQRATMIRLNTGAIVLFAFTDILEIFNEDYTSSTRISEDKKKGLPFVDAQGKTFTGCGLYGSVSFDEGKTWPVRKLITPANHSYMSATTDNTPFMMSPTNAEPEGYLHACQTDDGIIHLISSRLHYRFNLEWLEELTPGELRL